MAATSAGSSIDVDSITTLQVKDQSGGLQRIAGGVFGRRCVDLCRHATRHPGRRHPSSKLDGGSWHLRDLNSGFRNPTSPA